MIYSVKRFGKLKVNYVRLDVFMQVAVDGMKNR